MVRKAPVTYQALTNEQPRSFSFVDAQTGFAGGALHELCKMRIHEPCHPGRTLNKQSLVGPDGREKQPVFVVFVAFSHSFVEGDLHHVNEKKNLGYLRVGIS